jgi:aryl-alcohol dehydrogenase-like predicted oxidoreductase
MRDRVDTIEDSFVRRMVEVYGTDENFERLRRAQELGRKKDGCSAVQVALAWLLHKPFPAIPIVGVRTNEDLGSCAAATLLELSESELKWLNLEA